MPRKAFRLHVRRNASLGTYAATAERTQAKAMTTALRPLVKESDQRCRIGPYFRHCDGEPRIDRDQVPTGMHRAKN